MSQLDIWLSPCLSCDGRGAPALGPRGHHGGVRLWRARQPAAGAAQHHPGPRPHHAPRAVRGARQVPRQDRQTGQELQETVGLNIFCNIYWNIFSILLFIFYKKYFCCFLQIFFIIFKYFTCFQAQEARAESAGQTPSGVRLESILRSWARHQDTLHHRDVKMTAWGDLSQPLASVIPVFYLNTSNHRLTASPLRTRQQYKLPHNDKMTNSRGILKVHRV